MPITPRRNTARAIDISTATVYFAFQSGRLTYNCRTCGSQCCKGYGYEATRSMELDAQFEARHILRLFSSTGAHGAVTIQNLAPACFHLSTDGLCGIETSRGHAAKPETCRLFPFNNFVAIGNHLVVMPHQSLCPLEVVDGAGSGSDHAYLLKELTAFGVNGSVRTLPWTGDISSVINIERVLLRQLEHSPVDDLFSVLDQQLANTDGRGGGTLIQADRYCARMLDILGLDVRDRRSPSLEKLVLVLVPILRASYIFRQVDERVVPTLVRLLPNVIVAIYTIARLAEESGMSEITYQTIMQIVSGQAELIMLLAYLESHVALDDSQVVPAPARWNGDYEYRYLALVKSLCRNARASGPEVLRELLLRHVPSDASLRIDYLRLMAKQIAPRLRVCGDYGGGVSKWRARVQQHVIRQLPTEVLAVAWKRRVVSRP